MFFLNVRFRRCCWCCVLDGFLRVISMCYLPWLVSSVVFGRCFWVLFLAVVFLDVLLTVVDFGLLFVYCFRVLFSGGGLLAMLFSCVDFGCSLLGAVFWHFLCCFQVLFRMLFWAFLLSCAWVVFLSVLFGCCFPVLFVGIVLDVFLVLFSGSVFGVVYVCYFVRCLSVFFFRVAFGSSFEFCCWVFSAAVVGVFSCVGYCVAVDVILGCCFLVLFYGVVFWCCFCVFFRVVFPLVTFSGDVSFGDVFGC